MFRITCGLGSWVAMLAWCPARSREETEQIGLDFSEHMLVSKF